MVFIIKLVVICYQVGYRNISSQDGLTITAKMPNRNCELVTEEHLAYLPEIRPSSTCRTRDDTSVIVTCLEDPS